MLATDLTQIQPANGFEPSTGGLRNRCSTPELRWLKHSISEPDKDRQYFVD